jgi:hypothetical protein
LNNPTVYPDPSIVLAIYMRRAADRQRPAQIICHTETAVVNVDDVAAVEQEDDIDAPQDGYPTGQLPRRRQLWVLYALRF